jgi:hypothetical protein
MATIRTKNSLQGFGCAHNLEQYLDESIAPAGIAGDPDTTDTGESLRGRTTPSNVGMFDQPTLVEVTDKFAHLKFTLQRPDPLHAILRIAEDRPPA